MTDPTPQVPGDVRTVLPLNPDTRLPMPSPSDAQRALVDELLTTWDDAGLLDGPTANLRGTLRATLTEAVVRQHGRTLRACIDEIREAGKQFDHDARVLTDGALASHTNGAALDGGKISGASRLAAAAAALRTLMIRGTRA